MKTEQITFKESVYLIYAYFGISTFIVMAVCTVTENLAKAIYFNSIVSLLILINMIVFISTFILFKKKPYTPE